MWWKWIPSLALRAAWLVLAAAWALPASATDDPPAAGQAVEHTHPPAGDVRRALEMQNAERARYGLPPLVWSEKLARDSRIWAQTLVARAEASHSSILERPGEGENLWMGTAGAWDIEEMVNMFLEEQRLFHPGYFPDVSASSNWVDVGHYSQIVWRDTREVGCALESGNGMDVLVCRYFPAGNVAGRKPF